MRFLPVIFILLVSLSSGAQPIVSFGSSPADSLRNSGDLKGAIDAYRQELTRSPGNLIAAYNLACAFSVDGQRDSAFRYLWPYLKADTDAVTLDMLTDLDLWSLHSDMRWRQLEQERLYRYQLKNGYPIKDEAFALLLQELKNNDQYYRQQLAVAERLHGPQSKEVRHLWTMQSDADKRNQAVLFKEIARKGWPKISEVGKEGAATAFLIVQHSNLATMRKYLPLIKNLCGRGEARWQDYALMYDRVETMEGRPQLYGSQVQRRKGQKEWTLYPIANEEDLEERRRKMGLKPMGEYAATWGIKYVPKRAVRTEVVDYNDYILDTVFKQGQRVVFQERYFSDTRERDFPLRWTIGNNQCARFNYLDNQKGIVSRVQTLNGKRSLVVVDSPDAKIWNGSAGLAPSEDFHQVKLPPAFTIECSYFNVDSVCKRHGGGEFEIFFKEFLARYPNELNIRISDEGHFEMNCDANDSSLGLNSPAHCPIFQFSYVRSQGHNTPYHHEVIGRCPSFQKNTWHTLALSYSHRHLRCWLDDHYLGSIESHITPAAFSTYGIAEYGINNIRLAELDDDDELKTLVSTKKLVTHAIHFEVNSCEVKDESVPFIKSIAGWLTEHQAERIEISGHTDSTGVQTLNMELSQRRAEAIKALLNRYGVAKERVAILGYGATRPLASNATGEGRAMNRRVEFALF